MPTTYEPCGKDVAELVQCVLDEHHGQLALEGVTVHVLFCARSDKFGIARPGLLRQGYPLAAKIQITSLADRARGIADTKLVIDQYAWDHMPDGSHAALIDHELEHLQLAIDKKTGERKRDDLNRPMLKTRPHDYELAGFVSVVKRYGEASVEVLQLEAFKEEQLTLFPRSAQDGLFEDKPGRRKAKGGDGAGASAH